jgi:TolA-binding protein
MTNCTGTPAEQFLERYIQGTLSPSEQEEFEEHYFDCPVCLAQLEAMQTVKGRLARQPLETPRPLLRWPTGFGALGAIGALAAMLVIGFFCYRTFIHRSEQPATMGTNATTPQAPPVSQPASATPNTPAVSLLADLTLPAFQAASLRGTSEDSDFDTGMKAYAKSDCHTAINTLSHVEVSDSNALAAHFYSGVCQMHQRDFAAATVSLRRVSDAGDSPQQEAALYYLAQIALAKNDSAAARQYLDRTIALHGDFEQRVQAELAKLPVQAGHP